MARAVRAAAAEDDMLAAREHAVEDHLGEILVMQDVAHACSFLLVVNTSRVWSARGGRSSMVRRARCG
jgi:hypothetical protein